MIATENTNHPGYVSGFLLIGILGFLFLGGLELDAVAPWLAQVCAGLFLIAFGLMFLASYYYAETNFFLRGLLWMSENLSWPAHRKMAFVHSACLAAAGVAVLLVLK